MGDYEPFFSGNGLSSYHVKKKNMTPSPYMAFGVSFCKVYFFSIRVVKRKMAPSNVQLETTNSLLRFNKKRKPKILLDQSLSMFFFPKTSLEISKDMYLFVLETL